jgi:hypothetical protein
MEFSDMTDTSPETRVAAVMEAALAASGGWSGLAELQARWLIRRKGMDARKWVKTLKFAVAVKEEKQP